MPDNPKILDVVAEKQQKSDWRLNRFWPNRPMSHLFLLFPALLVCMCCLITSQTARAEGNGINVELNKVEDLNDACRMSFVFTNRLEVAVSTLSIETVLFDTSGSVIRFVVMNSRPLSPGKIVVQQYDVKKLKCSSLGRIILNDTKGCQATGLTPQKCFEKIKPTSRISVPFISTVSDRQG